MKNKDKLINVPNCMCFFRILLIPPFLIIYFNATEDYHYFIAAGILVISGISDYLDGFIARKYNMVTDFGKLFDPIADKLTQAAIAVALVYNYPLVWVLLVIIILKDGMLGIVGLYLYQYGLKIDGASWHGKISTAYFYLVVIILVAFHIPDSTISTVLIISSSVLMLISFYAYGKQLYNMNKYGVKDDG